MKIEFFKIFLFCKICGFTSLSWWFLLLFLFTDIINDVVSDYTQWLKNGK